MVKHVKMHNNTISKIAKNVNFLVVFVLELVVLKVVQVEP